MGRVPKPAEEQSILPVRDATTKIKNQYPLTGLRQRTGSPRSEKSEEVGNVDGAVAAGGGDVAEGWGASPVGEQGEKVGDIDVAVGRASGAVGGALAGVDDAVAVGVNVNQERGEE